MEDNKKIELLTEMFEMEDGELTPDTVLAELDNWDSMMKLSLIVLVNDECGKKLAGQTIKGFKTVKDIMDFMG